MRTRLLAVLAAAVLVLAACGDDDSDTAEPDAPSDATTETTAAEPDAPSDATTETTPAGDGQGEGASGQGEVVVVVEMSFDPATLEISAGDTVRWDSESDLPHTVTSTSGPLEFDESLPPGGSVSITFDEPGTYEYRCTLHPSMTGTIVVS